MLSKLCDFLCFLRSSTCNKILLFISLSSFFSTVHAQNFLSNLHATKDDAIYTTYAAPMSRSDYKIDQGYQLVWYDPEKGVNLESKDGGNLCLAFKLEDKVRHQLKEFYTEPIITASYGDLVKFYYYPFRDVRVDAFYDVYSSGAVIQEIKITNKDNRTIKLSVFPFFEFPQSIIRNVQYNEKLNYLSFEHRKNRDNWMKKHDIPYVENLITIYRMNKTPDRWIGLNKFISSDEEISFLKWVRDSDLANEILEEPIKLVSFQNDFEIEPGKSVSFRIIRILGDLKYGVQNLLDNSEELFSIDLEKLIKNNEKVYSNIPKIEFDHKDHEMLYWNAFSLIRQCMMPPEGECGYNYYIFSREPKWGWGYGGQVFHESLVMLAYAFMDAESAMNSQRVYIERQWDNGFINYRTGPYLNENIEYNEQFTSSAPWYNYQNHEIYKITNNKKFLEEAYKSGKKFYNYYVSNRDSNGNGLCEWGAHAELESVRDARVAVWDKVGWANNFEGPDVNSMLVMEAKSLSEMAQELGYIDEAEEWQKDAVKRSELINNYLWDPQTEFYYNIKKQNQTFTFINGNDLKIKEIIGFLPLWAGVPSKERANKLIKSLLNEEEFWRPFGVSTLSAKDDYYNPIGYWNGPIWVQWQYLVFRGLLDYGYINEAKELVRKVLDNIIHQLKIDHYFWEFYSADEYQAGWNKAYIWTGIIARFLIDLNSLK